MVWSDIRLYVPDLNNRQVIQSLMSEVNTNETGYRGKARCGGKGMQVLQQLDLLSSDAAHSCSRSSSVVPIVQGEVSGSLYWSNATSPEHLTQDTRPKYASFLSNVCYNASKVRLSIIKCLPAIIDGNELFRFAIKARYGSEELKPTQEVWQYH